MAFCARLIWSKCAGGGKPACSRPERRHSWQASSGHHGSGHESGNRNRPEDYAWLLEILRGIASNQAKTLGAGDAATGEALVPIFMVIGSCPNMWCGMQAVMYCAAMDGRIDFWWVKPLGNKKESKKVEQETLKLHHAGHHKNDPASSRSVYQPIADFFAHGAVQHGWRFGLEPAGGQMNLPVPRAFLERDAPGAERLYVYFVWQEDWTSNPLAWHKYIKGKIVFQKAPGAQAFHAQQYEISNGEFFLSEREEHLPEALLPGVEIKVLLDPHSASAAEGDATAASHSSWSSFFDPFGIFSGTTMAEAQESALSRPAEQTGGWFWSAPAVSAAEEEPPVPQSQQPTKNARNGSVLGALVGGLCWTGSSTTVPPSA